jgi:NAD(P)-dependent dehydrogenase (short-subunit alcohol dehydrogenase family)
MKSFKNKVVVITGAGSGMGRSYAFEFARRGAVLALNSRHPATLDETVSLLPRDTRSVSAAFDVSDRDSMYAFADRVRAELGPAHVVINNAGIEGGRRPVWATDDAEYERLMAVNFNGVLYGTRAFLPHVRDNGEGAIVNVSSIFGLTGTPNSSAYCASKFAVRGFTEALMVELVNEPITVQLIHPGGIATNIARSSQSQEFANTYLRTNPDAVAKHVADAIQRGRSRVVFGHGARKTHFGATFVPRRRFNRILWNQISPTIDKSDYEPPIGI